MGLEFIRAKGQKFVQRRDQSKVQELDTADLITSTKPDRVTRLYRCVLTDPGAQVVAGLGLTLMVMSDTQVFVLQHGTNIGYVTGEDVGELIPAMKRNSHVGGLLSVAVVDEPAFDGVFTVKPKTRFKK
ncbi:MAG TPA: hypothetical protein VHY22_18570 [Chthoniobacteraceae bacterium]|jgi:hypothetical protein|nr:hypothetical protein [Chthoniobacteraceae bacterium]